jgi:1-acyl-sn-glycerol-3-phosphate acyltransferase
MSKEKAMQVIRILFSIYYWIWFILVSLVFGSIATLAWMATAWWDPRRRLNNAVTWYWARAFLWGSPFWRVKVTGLEKIDNNRPTLLVANHLSSFDIYLIFCLKRHFHWISKRSNLWVPVLGWNMYYCRTVFLDRDSPRDVLKMVKESIALLREGGSLMIFPEGERSLTGHLQPFLGGAFTIAKKAHVPIQTIALTGTDQVLKRHQAILNPFGTMTATVLDPIPVEVVNAKSTEELSEMVWNQMVSVLPPEHQPLPEDSASSTPSPGVDPGIAGHPSGGLHPERLAGTPSD